MDSRNENDASSSSGSDSDVRTGSGVPGGHPRSTPQPRDTPTPQEDDRGPTAEFAQREQSLQPVESLAEMRRRTRGSPPIDYHSDVSGCSRESALAHRPSTAPPVPQDLMSEPLSQEFSECQIDLAARRIRVMKTTHSHAAAKGHLLHPTDAARAAAAVQMKDLQKAETESVAPVAENPRGHPRRPSAGRESTITGTTGTERSSGTVGGGTDAGSVNRSYYSDEDDMQMECLPFEYLRHYLSRGRRWYRRYKLAVIWCAAVAGAVLGFVLLGLLIQYIRHRNRRLAMTPNESEAETTTPFDSGYDNDKRPPYVMPFF
ncbi:hypothetical protein MTO96_021113 [Rhipicephalus appendiculatus]